MPAPGGDVLEVDLRARGWAGPEGPRPVLRDIRFTARPGETIALLAPSGTGKTTLLRSILGLDTGFTGTIRRPAGRSAALFQEPRLAPWLTLAGNLRLVLGPGAPDSRVAEALAEVGLAGAADLLPGEISLGMARRAALARALAVEPDLLVLDEPFASLDPATGAAVAARVRAAAARRPRIILFATHELGLALDVASRVLVLGGTPATLAADQAVGASGCGAGASGAGVSGADDAALLLQRFPFLRTQAGGTQAGETGQPPFPSRANTPS